FHGTTTRQLAEAAGVSEALLFKHFPNKEALFTAIKLSCCSARDLGRFEQLAALDPSALTLVLMVHFLVSLVLGNNPHQDEERDIPYRLMLRSLAEDGEFARVVLSPLGTDWVPKVEECMAAAVAAGDAVEGPVLACVGGWFIHHLAAMVMLLLL